MSEKIVQLNEEVIKGQLKELVRGNVEETLNELLEAKAETLTQATQYESNKQRHDYCNGHYSRNLTTTSGDITVIDDIGIEHFVRPLGGGAIFSSADPLLFHLLLRGRENLEIVRSADLFIGYPVGLQIGCTLVELPAVLEAHTVHHQTVV